MKRLRLGMVAVVVGAVAVVGVGSGGAAASPQSRTAKAPIVLGALTSLTSTFAPWGLQARDGMRLAVNEINKAGGVKGRKLKLVVMDDQSSPNAGIAGFKSLTQQSHVLSIGGAISSDVALATARLTEKAHVPMFLIKAGANEILTRNSRYTFRTCLPAAAEVAGPILQYAQTHHITSVGAIVADYAWGQSIKSSLENTFKNSSIKLNVQVAPVTATDFTTYLRALAGDTPQMLVATGHPPGTGAILGQSGQLGMKIPVTGAYTPFSLVAKAGSVVYGRYEDFKCENVKSKAYQDLARKFLKAYPNDGFFEDDALAGYAYVHIMAQAVGAVGTNRVKIAKYIHAHTFDIPGYTFPLKWTAWGEMAAPRIAFDILTKGPAPKGTNTAGTWYPKQLQLGKPLTPYKP